MSTWSTNGLLTNPATSALLADTGTGWGNGYTNITILVDSSVAVNIALESYNGGGTLVSHTMAISANSPFSFLVEGVQIDSTIGLRLRVVTGVTGSVQGSIFKTQ